MLSGQPCNVDLITGATKKQFMRSVPIGNKWRALGCHPPEIELDSGRERGRDWRGQIWTEGSLWSKSGGGGHLMLVCPDIDNKIVLNEC